MGLFLKARLLFAKHVSCTLWPCACSIECRQPTGRLNITCLVTVRHFCPRRMPRWQREQRGLMVCPKQERLKFQGGSFQQLQLFGKGIRGERS